MAGAGGKTSSGQIQRSNKAGIAVVFSQAVEEGKGSSPAETSRRPRGLHRLSWTGWERLYKEDKEALRSAAIPAAASLRRLASSSIRAAQACRVTRQT
jgi:hypothetical protein